MSKGHSGYFSGTKGSNYYRTQAEKALVDLIKNTPGAKKKAMAVAAYDANTGENVAVFSGKPPDEKDIHPQLKKLMERVGTLGSQGDACKNVVGACAEFHAINQLLWNGSRFEDIRLTKAIRPRTGKEVDYCQNCQIMFAEIIERSQ